MLSVEIKENDKVVGELAAAEKFFKTGSRGFFGMGKIQIGEKRYQVQVSVGGDWLQAEDGRESVEG